MKDYKIAMKELQQPFNEEDIEWRVQKCGFKGGKPWAMVFSYVTNRAIMERLDDIFGIANWKNEFKPGPSGGNLCGISIRIDGEWLTKWDGAENTNYEPVKGGLSDAMKRAAVQWGIGRYLYHLEVGFANINKDGRYTQKIEDKNGMQWVKWDPPQLPEWALPQKDIKIDGSELDMNEVLRKVDQDNMTKDESIAYYNELCKEYRLNEDKKKELAARFAEYFNEKTIGETNE